MSSDFSGSAVVEISYFTSGITWAADYVCVADTAEEQMSFDGFVRITNNSGEDYENAQVRLVVGQINLVERIADLARRGLVSKEDFNKIFGGGKVRHLKGESRSRLYAGIAGDMDEAARAPKAIVKEGLSEATRPHEASRKSASRSRAPARGRDRRASDAQSSRRSRVHNPCTD